MKNSTKNANMFGNIKTERYKSPKLLGGVAFMDIQNISKDSPFIYKATQEIHDKQVPK